MAKSKAEYYISCATTSINMSKKLIMNIPLYDNYKREAKLNYFLTILRVNLFLSFLQFARMDLAQFSHFLGQ